MSDTIPCILTGHEISPAACATKVVLLSSAELERCRSECKHGRALAKSAARQLHDAPPPPPPAAPEEQKISVRADLLALTGMSTLSKVSAKIGCTNTAVHQAADRLQNAKPIRSDNKVIPAIAALCGMTAAVLLARYGITVPADHFSSAKPPAPKPSESSSLSQPSGATNATPASEGPATPATEDDDTRGLDRLAEQMMADEVRGETSDESLSAIMTKGSEDAFAAAAEAMDITLGVPPAAPHPMMSMQEGKTCAEAKAETILPGDFALYEPDSTPPSRPVQATIDRAGKLTISAEAVRLHSLHDMPRCRLGYSPSTGMLGIVPTKEAGPGCLSMLRPSSGNCRSIMLRGLLHRYGIDLATVAGTKMAIHPGPAGMLVATINQPVAR